MGGVSSGPIFLFFLFFFEKKYWLKTLDFAKEPFKTHLFFQLFNAKIHVFSRIWGLFSLIFFFCTLPETKVETVLVDTLYCCIFSKSKIKNKQKIQNLLEFFRSIYQNVIVLVKLWHIFYPL